MSDSHTIDKEMFVGKTRSCGFLVYVRPYNQFGDVVISFKTTGGRFQDYPVAARPKVFNEHQHAKAANQAKALLSAL